MANIDELLVLETLSVNDTITGSGQDSVMDTVQVLDSTADAMHTRVIESVTVDDVVLAGGALVDEVMESVQVLDAVASSPRDTVMETVAVSDVTSGTFVEGVLESVTVSDSFQDHRTAWDAVAEFVSVDDFAQSLIQEDNLVNETVSVIEIVTDHFAAVDAVVESVTLDDSVLSWLSGDVSGVVDSVLETVRVMDTVSPGPGGFSDMVFETLTIFDTLYSRDFGALAWVMNTETGAPSVYDNFEFSGLVEHKGILVAAGREGLYIVHRHKEDDDEGRDVNAEIVSGFLDWETDQRKRLRDIYVGYTGGQLELTVETYNEPYERYTYEMVERDADAPRNNRIRVGRGLNSRFWRFTIRNQKNKWFQVYDSSANVDVSNRRL